MWKGKKIIQEYYNYYDLPWEKEAYELQEVLLNEYKKVWDKNPNMLVPYYLMFSYLYYKQNISLIDDAEYDTLCKTLLDKFDDIKHFHKHLINKDALTLYGTGYDIKYNNRIIGGNYEFKKGV